MFLFFCLGTEVQRHSFEDVLIYIYMLVIAHANASPNLISCVLTCYDQFQQDMDANAEEEAGFSL